MAVATPKNPNVDPKDGRSRVEYGRQASFDMQLSPRHQAEGDDVVEQAHDQEPKPNPRAGGQGQAGQQDIGP